ncbi:conserved hypothetical protein [Candida dubliniensis CD36]|uniref:Uncharacterized protein n=1 Tax=Candida dubliniensis (strain CD36 / ATCC MYA-646 / CBS 7987 / NCPF 3949 / NRRL Y-17841) TaxID=573826 RepID=B9W8G7_CANDC|nr:conserved hypothetical protein [Candida dubliniensis CD36]CAX45039.1 conserved hypothetical protein [Candida dubliniensis CD36]
MPSVRFKLIQKGSNVVNDEEKTLISIFKEAMESPELFQFKDYSEATPSKDVDFIVGFIKKKEYKKWFKSINLEYRWLTKRRIYSSSNKEEVSLKKMKKPSYLEEYYFDCNSSGTYNLKSQQRPESRYKNSRGASSIKTACSSKVYVKKPKSMSKFYLIGIIPRHNHPPINRGSLGIIAKEWLGAEVEMGYSKTQIKENLKVLQEQNGDSPNIKPLSQIHDYHIEYRIQQFANNHNGLNKVASINSDSEDIDCSFVAVYGSSEDSDSSDNEIGENEKSANNQINSTRFNAEQSTQCVNNSTLITSSSWNPHSLQSSCFGKSLGELTREEKIGESVYLLNKIHCWFDTIVRWSPEKIDESIAYMKGLECYMSSLATGVQYPVYVDEHGRTMYKI